MGTPDPLVDFETIVLELRRRGLSYLAIAKLIEVSETTVKNYGNLGARPSYEVGERLVKLWMGITFSERAQVPKVRVQVAR